MTEWCGSSIKAREQQNMIMHGWVLQAQECVLGFFPLGFAWHMEWTAVGVLHPSNRYTSRSSPWKSGRWSGCDQHWYSTAGANGCPQV